MYEANEATKTCWNQRKKSIMLKKSPQVGQWYGINMVISGRHPSTHEGVFGVAAQS